MFDVALALQVLHPLLQATADSGGTRIIVEHSWLDTMASAAQSLVSVLVLVMLVMGVLLLYALRRSIDELTKLIRSAYEPLRTAIGEAREATGELRTLVKGMQRPMEAAGAAVEEVAARVRDAADVAHDRLARLDALVDVVQGEAEEVVVRTASLMRGVGAGGRVVGAALGLTRRRDRRRSTHQRPDEDALDDELEDDLDDDPGEREPGDDAEAAEVPRIRRRAASHR